ncbi:hypothetical protein [Hellea balneolensis]|uniref:hypothetical protein n=1 Tax=Hellea balneolensis TaxID=287478 RepID=UPI000425CC58|nr:hypothetical protein [Hellea balneolensis]
MSKPDLIDLMKIEEMNDELKRLKNSCDPLDKKKTEELKLLLKPHDASHKQSIDFRSMLVTLFYSGAYGQSVTRREDIAKLIYVEQSPTPRPYTNTLHTSKRTDSNKKGKNRIGNIYDKERKISEVEGRHFHYYFAKLYGSDWGRVISWKDLVTKNFSANYNKALRAGLKIRASIPSIHAIQSLFEEHNHKHTTLEAQLVAKSTKRAAYDSAEPMPEYFYPADMWPTLKPDNLFVLDYVRINSEKKNVFLFESYDQKVAEISKNSEDHYALYPFNNIVTDEVEIELTPRKGPTFKISTLRGRFHFHVIEYPLGWDFQDKFGVDPNKKKWSMEESNEFLNSFGNVILTELDKITLSTFSYRVDF